MASNEIPNIIVSTGNTAYKIQQGPDFTTLFERLERFNPGKLGGAFITAATLAGATTAGITAHQNIVADFNVASELWNNFVALGIDVPAAVVGGAVSLALSAGVTAGAQRLSNAVRCTLQRSADTENNDLDLS